MKKNKVAIVVLAVIFFVVAIAGVANADANDIFARASITLSSDMSAAFSATTTEVTTISVSSCSLQKKVGGVWKAAGSLTAPASASNTVNYNKTKDYSGSCSDGITYRVVGTFNASGESVTRYSNAITY